MPSFVLNRNYTMRTLHGHIIGFVKGEPTHVPPVCVKDALLIGAEPIGEEIDILDPENEPVIPLSPDERQAALVTAFGMLEERNDSQDFSGNGIPTKAAVEKIVEFTVGKKEIEALWVAYVAEKSSVE
jgi:hypothetical protein